MDRGRGCSFSVLESVVNVHDLVQVTMPVQVAIYVRDREIEQPNMISLRITSIPTCLDER